MKMIRILLPALLLASVAGAQSLRLPPRPAGAMSGSEFAKSIASLELGEREEKIYEQIAEGNVPNFLRELCPIRVAEATDDVTNTATYYVTPDYLAVGSDEDYFLTPLSPITAQRVADLAHCSLPTKKMCDDIYRAAAVKLTPSPIKPSDAMATVPVFIEHNETVMKQRKMQMAAHPLGALVVGSEKDVVISARLAAAPGKVAIYGWHQADGKPIQPLYSGHADYYADYSHGIRLVQLAVGVNGVVQTVPAILASPALCGLLSDEGPIAMARYPNSFGKRGAPNSGGAVAAVPATGQATLPDNTPLKAEVGSGSFPPIKTVTIADLQPRPFDERLVIYNVEPEVRVAIDAPMTMNPNKKVKLIFYALPNGNTIEQTMGRRLEAIPDNWHFNIQHIGAQTRFLRQVLSNDCSVVVVYLESQKKSWPVWRKDHADIPGFIPALVDSVKGVFKDSEVEVTLSGHSGGGSLIFGYLNGEDRIPSDVERIAFLDANYGYDPAQGHAAKLLQWLNAPGGHCLSVLAYNDAMAMLDGKHFVTAEGGTWGRSHAMLRDLESLHFNATSTSDPEVFTALDGRVKLLLKENPDQKVLHSVQVEKNGFIQSILAGTPYEGKGYEYFGSAAYTDFVGNE